jgi:large subunit ribosomal protein L22
MVVTMPRPGTRAQVRYVRMSATKARAVLDLIRGKAVAEAEEALVLSQRDPARVIQKCLRSAVANAEHNDQIDADDLFVSSCFADEGPTLRRFRPRARGRATRIRKRTCHITVIVSRYDQDELEARRAREEASGGGRRDTSAARRRRVAKSRGEEEPEETVEEVPEAAEQGAAADETGADAEGSPPEGEGSVTALVDSHSKDELLEIAEAEGVEAPKSWNKGQIAEAIVEAREAKD